MKNRYILDTSAILSQPSTAAYSSLEHSIEVPDVVMDELAAIDRSRASGSLYAPLLQQAVSSGTVTIGSTFELIELSGGHGTSSPEGMVLAYAEAQSREYPEDRVAIVSRDKDIVARASTLGIEVLSPEAAEREIQETGEERKEVAEVADEIARFQLHHVLGSFTGGVAIAIVGHLVWTFRVEITSNANVWIISISIPILAVILYALRAHRRTAYGVTEFVVGLVAAVRVFFPDFDVNGLNAATALQLIAALYIMVRGLDNVGIGLEGTRLGAAWRARFPE